MGRAVLSLVGRVVLTPFARISREGPIRTKDPRAHYSGSEGSSSVGGYHGQGPVDKSF
jgi:hypothetical protein